MTSVIRLSLRDKLSRLASFLESLQRGSYNRLAVKQKFCTALAWLFGACGAFYSLGVVWHPFPTGVEIARRQESFVALSDLIGDRAVLAITHHMAWGAIYFVPLLCTVVVTWSLCKRAELRRAQGRSRFPRRDLSD